MIFDRTAADVENAKSIRTNKVQKGSELSAEDIVILEKGTMTINTLNRIETKQEELKNLINDLGYWNTPIINKVWDHTQIFYEADLQRIIDNTTVLRTAFFTYKDTPCTPIASYHYNDINALEKILHDLDIMINDIKSCYRQCGTFQCGEVNES